MAPTDELRSLRAADFEIYDPFDPEEQAQGIIESVRTAKADKTLHFGGKPSKQLKKKISEWFNRSAVAVFMKTNMPELGDQAFRLFQTFEVAIHRLDEARTNKNVHIAIAGILAGEIWEKHLQISNTRSERMKKFMGDHPEYVAASAKRMKDLFDDAEFVAAHGKRISKLLKTRWKNERIKKMRLPANDEDYDPHLLDWLDDCAIN